MELNRQLILYHNILNQLIKNHFFRRNNFIRILLHKINILIQEFKLNNLLNRQLSLNHYYNCQLNLNNYFNRKSRINNKKKISPYLDKLYLNKIFKAHKILLLIKLLNQFFINLKSQFRIKLANNSNL